MSQQTNNTRGRDPALGGRHAVCLTGMEPALSRDFGPLYGRFRVRGLEAPVVAGRRRPLVIFGEYDPDTAHLIHLVADSNGYEVKITPDGMDALSLVTALSPDLLVLNIRLASASGLDIIRGVRGTAELSLRLTPVLVMDVHRRQQDILAAFAAGADDYLEMPYDIQVMLRCWRRVTSAFRRPSPLTALQNEDAMIQQIALAYLLEANPDGLVAGLSDLLATGEPALQVPIRWALRRLGTAEALEALKMAQPLCEPPSQL